MKHIIEDVEDGDVFIIDEQYRVVELKGSKK